MDFKSSEELVMPEVEQEKKPNEEIMRLCKSFWETEAGKKVVRNARRYKNDKI